MLEIAGVGVLAVLLVFVSASQILEGWAAVDAGRRADRFGRCRTAQGGEGEAAATMFFDKLRNSPLRDGMAAGVARETQCSLESGKKHCLVKGRGAGCCRPAVRRCQIHRG